MFKREKTYRFFQFITWVVIPLCSITWYIVSGILHTPTPSPVVGVAIVIDAYLGINLQLSVSRFIARKPDGTIVVTTQEDRKVFTLELDDDPENLEDRDKVVFRVKKAE